MKLFKSINKRIVSVALATAMAFGFAVAPVPSMLDGGVVGQSVAYAEAHNVTSLPTPDAEGQGGGSTQQFDMWRDQFSTVRDGDQQVPVNAMILLAFNKNATSTRLKYPDDPYDVILVNKDKVRIKKFGTNIEVVSEAQKVSDQMISDAGYSYTERNYRNYIYLGQNVLEPNTKYTIEVDQDFRAANGDTLADKIEIHFTTASN